MSYTGMVKSLDVPVGFQVPGELVYDDLRATPIERSDLSDDIRGINSSLDLIRRTRGGWPDEAVAEDDNYVDIVWHELENREGYSYAYVVRDAEGTYLGCCYLYPMGRRVPLTDELMDHDVDASWWVTEDAYQQGYYSKVHEALGHWVDTAFPFTNPYYSNQEIPGRG
ncbi:MAG: GNAT family N-acetyltransferase [Acidimicrobiia bacterium]|nr:GNAT family N-acetyltransferase [Acidimicrobiia bacterium]